MPFSISHIINLKIFRTIVLPIQYKKMEDGMKICEYLGEKGDFLKPFDNFEEYVQFYDMYLKNPAIHKYCDHGNKYYLWLPFKGWREENEGPFNITYYKSNQLSFMNSAWRGDHPKTVGKWFCVEAKMKDQPSSSWYSSECEAVDWFSAPCSACSLPNSIGRNIEFNLRGLCER